MSKLPSDSVDTMSGGNTEDPIMSTLSVCNSRDFKNSDIDKTELKEFLGNDWLDVIRFIKHNL
jgi:hypothetical protein